MQLRKTKIEFNSKINKHLHQCRKIKIIECKLTHKCQKIHTKVYKL